MGYWPPRRPRPPDRPPDRPSAVQEMLAREEGFAERPFGTSAGEMLPRPEPAPAPAERGLVIEPPPWAGQEAGSLVIEPAEPEQLGALEVMKLEGDDVVWPEPPGPPMVTPPLSRPQLPAPDWRAEQAELQRKEKKP